MSSVMVIPGSSESDGWNPRYLAYCIANNRTPEQQIAHDDQNWPGAKMLGFYEWHEARIQEFVQLQSEIKCPGMAIRERRNWIMLACADQYDPWLQARALELRKELDVTGTKA